MGRFIRTLIILASIAYLQISTRIFQGLWCVQWQGATYIKIEKKTQCWVGAHISAAISMIMIGIFYCVAFPIWSFKTVKAVHQTTRLRSQSQMVRRHKKFGYLYRDLVDDWYWYRLLMFPTSFFLALANVMFDGIAPTLISCLFIFTTRFLIVII